MDVTITPAQMKALEASYMQETGVPGALLMEHAAQGVAAAMASLARSSRALVLCGPGNNGGDGYAAARLWQAGGKQALVWELSPAARGDAGLNRMLARSAGVRIETLREVPEALPDCGVIVDALFGTGLSREVDGAAAGLIRLINGSGIPVVAVDIPSGLDGETGRVWGCAVNAAKTVTFHRIKPGLLLGEGPAHTGALSVQPILIPRDYGDTDGMRCITPDDLPRLIPPRSFDAHKGVLGRVVLFAGSPGMAGAAAFAANAAMRTGAGLTHVLCRESILPIVQTLAPGATCTPLPEADGRLTAQAASLAAAALQGAHAAAVGCGLGQGDDLLPMLSVFWQAELPVVWDADALNLLARHPELLPLKADHLITPHPGEAARLLGCMVLDIAADPLAALTRLRQLCGCHVLLKGARSLMTDGERVAINRYGTPAMAKGGSGDVLTGIAAALFARRLPDVSPLEKVQAAALVHGLAGLRAEKLRGENGVTAQDLTDCIRLDAQA